MVCDDYSIKTAKAISKLIILLEMENDGQLTRQLAAVCVRRRHKKAAG